MSRKTEKVTIESLAEIAEVPLTTLRGWVVRGYLVRSGREGNAFLYDVGENCKRIAYILKRRDDGFNLRAIADEIEAGLHLK